MDQKTSIIAIEKKITNTKKESLCGEEKYITVGN